MKTRTACLPLGQLEPGMITETPVSGPQGTVLLAAGTTLDEYALMQLGRRAIEFVTVSVPDTRSDETIAREVAAASARVEFIFRGEDSSDSSSRSALRNVVMNYRRQQAE
jgi:hypothetical protein